MSSDTISTKNSVMNSLESANTYNAHARGMSLIDPAEVVIEVSSLSKCYQIYERPHDRLLQMFFRGRRQYFTEFWALNDVSFEIRRGETVGIVGCNGSGKSTLLQLICGTLNPTSGTVTTNGRIAALLELGSGFNPEFTGRENVYLNCAVLGLDTLQVDARFSDIVAFADIGDFLDQPVKTYSSGMVVRLAFAVAINVEPQILIIDEALSVGDELFQRKCFSRIEAIKRSGATILFVSHSGATVIELCDRAILMDSGACIATGAPKAIINKYQRLLYAPADRREKIRAEISSAMAESSNAFSLIKTDLDDSTDEGENLIEEFFDAGLTPQSTVMFESRGAHIDSPNIQTLSGQSVNCLKRGKGYRYVYGVTFDIAAKNVRFGMLIKTVSGLELGGGVSAVVEQAIPEISAGTRMEVEFRFTCTLNPDTYFLNAGVVGIVGDEEIYLHRILDACMFRIMPETQNVATGTVDFNCIADARVSGSVSATLTPA